MQTCKSNEYCYGLDRYLEKIWKAGNQDNVMKVDKFTKHHFWRSREVSKDLSDKGLTCHYLQKFTPLQGHLYGTKPNQKLFNLMAEAAYKSPEYLTECSDYSKQKSLKVAMFQFETSEIREKYWDKKGFDHWHSLKLFLSWAWRNAPEMEQMAFPFSNVFKGIILEERLMLFPNGCKGLAPANCNSDTLTQNVLREFAKDEFRSGDHDVLTSLPDGPTGDILDDRFTDVNNDILDLGNFPGAHQWAERYQENMAKARGVMKKKLIGALNFLNISLVNLKKEKLFKAIEDQFKETFELSSNNAAMKNELFYLCAEFNFTHHKDFSMVRGDLDLLGKTTLVDGIGDQIAHFKVKEFVSYYKDLAELVTKFCGSLEQRQIWNDEFELDRKGYSPWYIEKVYKNKFESQREEYAATVVPQGQNPWLTYSNWQGSRNKDDVVCYHPAHCARKTLQSIVDLYAVTKYGATFFTLGQSVQTPDLFNPYAERTACKVYDPWYKTRSVLFNFFSDIAQAALSVYVPGAIYTRFNLVPGSVASFNQLVDNGNIEFDPNYDRGGLRASLIADFGPLLGVPCSVSITPSDLNPYNTYRFAGISVSACTQNSDNNLIAFSGSDIRPNDTSNFSGCASCSINFESVVGSLSTLAPQVGPYYFAARALIRLYTGLKDPNNIPRSWEANPSYVLQTWRRFGEIPKRCVRRLRKGKRCLKDFCEEKVADLVNATVTSPILSIQQGAWDNHIEVKVRDCKKPLIIRGNRSLGDSHSNLCSISQRITIPQGCEKIRRKF